MLMTEVRYAKTRRVMDVAARLIDFEARTGTIRQLTGLSDSRIRSLSKECGVDGTSGLRVRHRGAAPRRVAPLLDKARPRHEAASLLALCRLMGLGVGRQDRETGRGGSRLARAERLCDVYWTFRYLFPQAAISFEHMLLLLSEAARGEELAVTHCRECQAMLLVDALSLYSPRCSPCSEEEFADARMAAITPRYLRVAEEQPAYK